MPGYEETLNIDGLDYTVHRPPWGVMKKNLSLISKITGDSAKAALGTVVDTDAWIRLIASILYRIDSSEMNDVLNSLGSHTFVLVNGKKKPLNDQAQNLHWQEHPSHFFPWLTFALKVNYADFFGGAKNGITNIVSDLRNEIGEERLQILTGLRGES